MKRKAKAQPIAAPPFGPLTGPELKDLEGRILRRAWLDMALYGSPQPDPVYVAVLRLIAEVKERRLKALGRKG